jgi:hypothetical protein
MASLGVGRAAEGRRKGRSPKERLREGREAPIELAVRKPRAEGVRPCRKTLSMLSFLPTFTLACGRIP